MTALNEVDALMAKLRMRSLIRIARPKCTDLPRKTGIHDGTGPVTHPANLLPAPRLAQALTQIIDKAAHAQRQMSLVRVDRVQRSGRYRIARQHAP